MTLDESITREDKLIWAAEHVKNTINDYGLKRAPTREELLRHWFGDTDAHAVTIRRLQNE